MFYMNVHEGLCLIVHLFLLWLHPEAQWNQRHLVWKHDEKQTVILQLEISKHGGWNKILQVFNQSEQSPAWPAPNVAELMESIADPKAGTFLGVDQLPSN